MRNLRFHASGLLQYFRDLYPSCNKPSLWPARRDPIQKLVKPAERIEMRSGDTKLGLFEIQLGQVLNEHIRGRDGQQLGDIEGLLADKAGRVADAAHGGVFDERLDGRGAWNAHVDGERNPLVAQAPRPICHRCRLEEKLSGDIALDAVA